MAEAPEAITPSLKITGLHIAGFRSIQKLDWPEDGLGWAGKVPDIVLVGGANGSGKTTLLEGLYSVFEGLTHHRLSEGNVFPGASEVCLNLQARSRHLSKVEETLRLTAGEAAFVRAQSKPDDYRIQRGRDAEPDGRRSSAWNEFLEAAGTTVFVARGEMPRVIYFPSDRKLNLPGSRKPNFLPSGESFPVTWRFSAAESYEDSLTALLYRARWEDLNAEKEGRPEAAKNFDAYADAFHRFVAGSKRLLWHHANLRVQMADGSLHDLPELSSGEKQILIFAAELRRQWSPGSLVLIDEPELHLHEAWQSTLFELIRDLQRERGGQVILATQSNHLFGLGDAGSHVVLRKGWP